MTTVIDGEDEQEDEPEDVPLATLWEEAYKRDTFEEEILELLRINARKSSKITLAECEEREGRLYWRERRYVPESDLLRLRLIQECHCRLAAGHPGKGKTYQLLSRHYWWPNCCDDVKRFVRNCHTCSRNKSSRSQYQGWLKPLPPPERRWQWVTLDYVGPLPDSTYQGVMFKYILASVCRLSKMKHFVAMQSMEPKEAAEAFYHYVWTQHGVPEIATSDRGSQFISEFWKHLCRRLGIKRRLSTAFHPETDGQTEKSNSGMEEYLRSYVNYHQDDWAEWLPGSEFAANNVTSVTTGCSPFFANSGQHPRMGFENVEIRPGLGSVAYREALHADAFANKMRDVTAHLQDEMLIAQAEYEVRANKHRTPAPVYRVGDGVWLNAKNLRRARPVEKLSARHEGPFKVIEVMGPVTYRLELPPSMQNHPVFHTNLLLPAANDPLPGQRRDPQPPVTSAEGDQEWYLDAILDSRVNRRRRNLIEYKVQWEEGQGATWEPWENVTNARDALEEFHLRYPHKPRGPGC